MKILSEALFDCSVLLYKPLDEVFALADQGGGIFFDLILAVGVYEKLNPANLKLQTEEVNKVRVRNIVTLGVTHTAVEFVEDRVVRGSSIEGVGQEFYAQHDGVSGGWCWKVGEDTGRTWCSRNRTLDRRRSLCCESLQKVVVRCAERQS